MFRRPMPPSSAFDPPRPTPRRKLRHRLGILLLHLSATLTDLSGWLQGRGYLLLGAGDDEPERRSR